MNDKKEVSLDKKKEGIKIKGDANKDKKFTIEITEKDGKIDIKGKENDSDIEISATIKDENKKDDKGTPVKLKGKLKIGWYGDSIVVKETDNTALKELESEIKVHSRRIHKPVLWVTIFAGLLLVGGLIWWWVASSKKEDKEEESL